MFMNVKHFYIRDIKKHVYVCVYIYIYVFIKKN